MMLAEEVNELWKWPNFFILAGLLGYLIKKHGAPLLAARSQQIREGLEAGEKAKAEAEVRSAAVQARIANLDRVVAELRVAAHADLEKEADRIRRDADHEISRIEQHTAMEIVSIGKQTRLELRHYAAKLAMDLAEQKVRAGMSPAVQATLLNNFSSDIAGYALGNSAPGGSQHV